MCPDTTRVYLITGHGAQCSKRPNPLKLTLVGIFRFSGALVGPSRGSRHMTSLHVKTKHTCHVTRPT